MVRRIAAAVVCLGVAASDASAQVPVPSWQVSATPLLTIEDDGGAGRDLHRVVTAARLADGRIAVVNNGSHQLRVFNTRGELDYVFGRQGSGPGEFEFPLWTSFVGDTAFVLDPVLRRITAVRLGAQPELVSTTLITARGGVFFELRSRLADGRWGVSAELRDVPWSAREGLYPTEVRVGVMRADASGEIEWLDDLAGPLIHMRHRGGGLQNSEVGPAIFSARVAVTASGDVLWIGSGAEQQLHVVKNATSRRSRVPLGSARRAVDPTLVAERSAEDDLQDPAGRVRRRTSNRYLPENLPRWLPYFEALIPGVDGEVWVMEYAGVLLRRATYVVYGSDGKARGRVTLADRERLISVGPEHLVILHRDEDWLESVLVRSYRRDVQ